MIIIAVEDEPIALKQLIKMLFDMQPGADILGFENAREAETYIKENDIDIAFLDISLGGISGVDLAKTLKSIQPTCNIVFCTGFSEYMPEGFSLGVSDYLLKPITKEKLQHAFDNLRHAPKFRSNKDTIFVRCFGEFEVFYNDSPLKGLTKRGKELFAYLVDKRGTMCSTKDILERVFRDRADVNLRIGRSELESALDAVGKKDILIRTWGKIGINPNLFLCDFYEYRDGNPEAIHLYHGVYMQGYDWALYTRKSLERAK